MSKKKKITILVIAIVLILAIIATVVILLKVNKKFTVSFDTDGGSKIESVQVKKNDTCKLPKDPEKEGYVFLYWMDENGNSVLKDFKVTKDRKLKAKWAEEDAQMFTVKFDTDGGSSIPDLLVIQGEKVALPDDPTKDGYDFKMWVDSEGKQFDKDKIIEEDITLKAVWEKQKEEEKKDDKKNETKNDEGNKEEPKPAQNVDVTGITLDKSQVDLIIGNSGKLTANVSPSNATNKSVTWSSSDPSVIAVDGSGNISAKAIGSATITAKTANGKTASATVYSDVESISLSLSNSYISHYGSPKSATLTVTTVPQVKDAYICWNSPNSVTGHLTVLGSTAYFYADETTSYQANNISAYVGRKTSNTVTVYVEPELNAYVSQAPTYENGNGIVQANIPVKSWSFGATPTGLSITNISEGTTSVSFTANNTNRNAVGIQVTATSKTGQTAYVRVTIPPTRQ